MNPYVLKYINTKRVNKKLSTPLTASQLEGLANMIEVFGNYVFTRNKSSLSSRIIENTIPTMLANNISTIVENIKQLENVSRNSYEHYQLLYGDNAQKIYTERTNKSVRTLDNFIRQYGESLGTKKYNNLLQRRSTQNTLESFINRHGKEIGAEKYYQYRQRLKYKNTVESYIELYGPDIGEQLYNERYPSEYDLTVFRNYKKAVYKLSNKIYNQYKNQINPNDYPRTKMGVEGGWQLDHIKPVNECFKEGISIEDASSIHNLRMLPWKDNLMRNFGV